MLEWHQTNSRLFNQWHLVAQTTTTQSLLTCPPFAVTHALASKSITFTFSPWWRLHQLFSPNIVLVAYQPHSKTAKTTSYVYILYSENSMSFIKSVIVMKCFWILALSWILFDATYLFCLCVADVLFTFTKLFGTELIV